MNAKRKEDNYITENKIAIVDWTRSQVEAAVADYKEMLKFELQGIRFNKAARNLLLQTNIQRSRGSIERKHQNISAALRDLGMPFIDGYKPLGNRQGILDEVVVELIAADEEMNELMGEAVSRENFTFAPPGDFLGMKVDAPKSEGTESSGKGEGHFPRPPILGKNYLEREARNRALGLAGEELMLEFEHQRLRRAGKNRLAERIEHVSRTQGDGLGYDIISYELNGMERLIEVKTTQFGSMTPFFASRNEVAVSEEKSGRYQIYRVFSFPKKPKFFALPGSMAESCDLRPSVYQASPK